MRRVECDKDDVLFLDEIVQIERLGTAGDECLLIGDRRRTAVKLLNTDAEWFVI